MKCFVLILSFSLCCLELSAQSDYYERQVRSHQSDAAYYVKQAQGYDRDAEYYMREAAGHLRDAEYYQWQKQFEQARSSLRKSRNAIESRWQQTQSRQCTVKRQVVYATCGRCTSKCKKVREGGYM